MKKDGIDAAGKYMTTADVDEEKKKERIIAMLENWAAWEKSLEDLAERDELARSIKEAADDTVSSPRQDIDHSGNTDNKLTKVPLSNGGGAKCTSSGLRGGCRPSMERQRSHRVSVDPVTMARRKCLNAWAADRVRRRPSDASHNDEKLAKAVADGSPSTHAQLRRSSAVSPRHFALPEIILKKDMTTSAGRSLTGTRREPTKSPQPPLQLSPETSPDHRSHRSVPYPWRRTTKGCSSKLTRSPGSNLMKSRKGGVDTAPCTPRPTESAADMGLARRPSPWARSPSRERAGGLLVNQRLFYGSGSRRAQAAAMDDSPSFEAGWMRQLREEIASNADWWVGQDRRRPRVSSVQGGIPEIELQRGRPDTPDGRDRIEDERTIDLWGEVGLRLARSKRGGDQECAVEGAGEAGASEAERRYVQSFQDRLRYAPLSQGAWLVGGAAATENPRIAASKPHGSISYSPAHSRNECGGESTSYHSEMGNADGNVVARPMGTVISKQNDDKHQLKEKNRAARARAVKRPQEDSHNLQDVYEALLVKLRGEIGAFTREGIVLSAAEDARGALARARELSVSPRSRRAHGRLASIRAIATPSENSAAVPEAIDYDHVEATLSLIELASRAAGPDAGRQMLQALEGLDKINQQARLEKGTEDDDGTGGEDRHVRSTREVSDQSKLLPDGEDNGIGRRSDIRNSGDSRGVASGLIFSINSWFRKGTRSESPRYAARPSGANSIHNGRGDEERSPESATRRAANALDYVHGMPASDIRRTQERRDAGECDPDAHGDSHHVGRNGNRSPDGDHRTHVVCGERGTSPGNTSADRDTVEASGLDGTAGDDGVSTPEEYYMAWDGSITGLLDECVHSEPKRSLRQPQKQQQVVESTSAARCHRNGNKQPGNDLAQYRGRDHPETPRARESRGSAGDCAQREPGKATSIWPSQVEIERANTHVTAADGQGGQARQKWIGDMRDDGPLIVGDRRGFSRTQQPPRPTVDRLKIPKLGIKPTSINYHHHNGFKRCGPERASTKSATISIKPSIIRRCPLIDALHPALVWQRAPREPSQPEPNNLTAVKDSTERSTVDDRYRAKTEVDKATQAAGCVTTSFNAFVAENDASDHPSRNSAPHPPILERRPSRMSLYARMKKTERSMDKGDRGIFSNNGVGRRGSKIEDNTARAGRLTALQWECVESWMVRVRDIMGEDAWKCLGVSPSFCRLRDHLKKLLSPGACVNNLGCDRAPGKDEGTMDSQSKARRETPGGLSGGWDDYLSQKTALALEATIWILESARERPVLLSDTVRDGARQALPFSESSTFAFSRNQRPCGDKIERISTRKAGVEVMREMPEANLGVSLPRARRFVKSCRLVNRGNALDAEIDLAFQRWQEMDCRRKMIQLATAAGSPASCSSESIRESLGWTESSHAAGVGWARDEGKSELKSTRVGHDQDARAKLCEAVGCSESARYGSVRPRAKAGYCLRHRADGMVDIAGPRCERPDCDRPAGGRNTSPPRVFGGGLCVLHRREGRVGVEGLASVLLSLAKANQNHLRRSTPTVLSSMTPTDASSDTNVSTTTGAEKCLDEAVRNSFAVRNVLLALTHQPLLPGPPVCLTAGGRRVDSSSSRPTEVRSSIADESCITLDIDVQRPPPEAMPTTSIVSRVHLRAPMDRSVRRGAGAQGQTDNRGSLLGPSGMFGVSLKTIVSRLESSGRGTPSLTDENETEHLRASGSLGCGWRARGRSLVRREIGIQQDESTPPCSTAPSRTASLFQVGNLDVSNSAVQIGEDNTPTNNNAQDATIAGSGCSPERNDASDNSYRDDSNSVSVVDDAGTVSASSVDGAAVMDDAIGRKIVSDRSRPEPVDAEREGYTSHLRKGIAKVLGQNIQALDIVFLKNSRTMASGRAMALPDLLHFCDSFELQPGLVTTREILDAYKEVVFQGLLGITDEDIGYCEPMSITVHRGRTAPPGERPVHSPNNNSIAKNACDIEAADGGGASHANNAVNTSSIRGCETVGRNCPDDEDNIGRSNCGTVTGKKERRATYLGRSQKFPLRQVQSLAVSDRRVGFGGVTGTSSGDRVWRPNSSSLSRKCRSSSASAASRRASISCDVARGTRGVQEPPIAPGLSLPQFLQWLEATIATSAALTKKFQRLTVGLGSLGSGRPCARGRQREDQAKRALMGTGAARAVAFLQWMELSRGMGCKRIPAFCLASPKGRGAM